MSPTRDHVTEEEPLTNTYIVHIRHALPGVTENHYSKSIEAESVEKASTAAIADFKKALPFLIEGEVIEVESATLQEPDTEILWFTQIVNETDLVEIEKLVCPKGTYEVIAGLCQDTGEAQVGRVIVDRFASEDDLGDEHIVIEGFDALMLFMELFKMPDAVSKIMITEGE